MYGDDAALLDAWITSRDAAAFKELTQRYSGMVYGTCLRLLRNSADAEELTQECFLNLAETESTPRQSLGGWLHSVAHNKSINRIRSDVRREKREESFVRSQEPAVEITWNDLIPLVDEAIAALPEDLQGPVVAHFLEDRTHAEISDAAGLKREAVTYRIKKGVDQIRGKLERKGVVVSSGGLVALFQTNAAIAAPSHLSVLLGKLALGGSVVQTGIATSALTISGAWIAALVLVMIGAVGGVLYVQSDGAKEPVPSIRNAAVSNVETTGDEETSETPAVVASAGLGLGNIPSLSLRVQGPTVPGPGITRGVVLDEDGNPVSGATVRIDVLQDGYVTNWTESRYLKETKSDDKGEYEFTEIPHSWHDNVPSRSLVWAVSEGRTASRRSNHYGGRSTRPMEGEIKLQPAEPLVGRLVNAEGAGVAGASVFPVNTASRDGGHFEAIAWGVRTDESGHFRFEALESNGVWKLMVRTAAGATAELDVSELGEDLEQFDLSVRGQANGRLVAVDSERPVTDANILVFRTDNLPDRGILLPWNATVVSTDGEGTYSLPELTSGTYEATLVPEHEYLYVLDGDASAFDIVAEETTAVPDMKVREGSNVIGRVIRDSTGEPLGGMKVTLELEGQRVPVPNHTETEADSEGNFSFLGIPDGKHNLVVAHKRQPLVVTTKNTFDDILLRSENVANVAGVVVDEDGVPVAGAKIRFDSYTNTDRHEAYTDRHGRFTAGPMIPCDDLLIMAFTPSHIGQTEERLTLEDTGLGGVKITLDRPLTATVSGSVFNEKGNPYYRAEVRLVDSDAGFMNSTQGRVAANGNFEIKNVATGTYGVQVVAPRTQFFTEGNYKTHITLSDGEKKTGLVLSLAGEKSKNLSISGTVVDGGGKPLADANIDVHLNNDLVRTSASGRFTVKRLAGGNYYVYARKKGYGQAYVEAQAGSGTPAKIVLHRLGHGTGRIVASDTGQPITEFNAYSSKVQAPYTDAPRFVPERLSFLRKEMSRQSEDGTFDLQNIQHGKGYIIASAPGYQPTIKAMDFNTSAGAINLGTLRLVPCGTLSIAVKTEDGTPVKNCSILPGKSYLNQRQRFDDNRSLGRTNQAGEFKLSSMGTSSRLVTVYKEGFAPKTVAIPHAVLSEDASVEVTLSSGGTVSGTVKFPKDTGSIYSMSLKHIGMSDEPSLSSPIVNGKYKIADIPPGEYDMSVGWSPDREGGRRWNWTKRIVVVAGDEIREDLVIALGNSTLKIDLKGGEIDNGVFRATLDLEGENGWRLEGTAGYVAGRPFEFRSVPSGSATLRFPQGFYGGDSSTHQKLDFESGAELTIAKEVGNAGSLSVNVTSLEPGVRGVRFLLPGTDPLEVNSLADVDAIQQASLEFGELGYTQHADFAALDPGTYTVAVVSAELWTDSGLRDAVVESHVVEITSGERTVLEF